MLTAYLLDAPSPRIRKLSMTIVHPHIIRLTQRLTRRPLSNSTDGRDICMHRYPKMPMLAAPGGRVVGWFAAGGSRPARHDPPGKQDNQGGCTNAPQHKIRRSGEPLTLISKLRNLSSLVSPPCHQLLQCGKHELALGSQSPFQELEFAACRHHKLSFTVISAMQAQMRRSKQIVKMTLMMTMIIRMIAILLLALLLPQRTSWNRNQKARN